MLVFYRPYTDPYFNIAAEEYFVKHALDDICMIWISEPSVIIGKHQNAFAEINYPYVRKNHIPVIRRISGGGAVYHDTGNVNFTFVQKTKPGFPVDFTQFTSIIIRFTESLGIVATTNSRNSLFAGDLKFSGHAEHIFHDKVLHHGTILFSTNLEILQHSLTPLKEYQGKALQSVRSKVGNLAPLLPQIADVHEFVKQFTSWLNNQYPGSHSYYLTQADSKSITELAETKYKTWQWNFGYSPAYTFDINIPASNGNLMLKIKVENGIITSTDISGVAVNQTISNALSGLAGTPHHAEALGEFIRKNQLQLELAGIKTVTFSEAFFI